jgi:hypothetical protein
MRHAGRLRSDRATGNGRCWLRTCVVRRFCLALDGASLGAPRVRQHPMAAGPRGFISRFAVLPASQFHLVAVGEVEVPRVCGVRPLRADEKPEHGAVHGAQQRRRHDAPGRGTAGWCYMAAQGTIMQAECGRLAAGPTATARVCQVCGRG